MLVCAGRSLVCLSIRRSHRKPDRLQLHQSGCAATEHESREDDLELPFPSISEMHTLIKASLYRRDARPVPVLVAMAHICRSLSFGL